MGLDVDIDKFPRCVRGITLADKIVEFNTEIVEATRHVAGAYKPNIAFYERYGTDGLMALKRTMMHIRNLAPQVPVILDAKRADIGSTNVGYIKAAFEYLGADAITVHPYLGREAMQPFLSQKNKGIFVLCRTSNPGAGEFQNLLIEGKPLYQRVARNVARDWNGNGNCALVVGATYPEELCEVRALVGDMLILNPGIGAQGGDLEKTVRAGKNSLGTGMIIAASRSVIYASDGEDYPEAAHAEVQRMNERINTYRQ